MNLLLFFLQFAILVHAEWNTKDFLKREHSLVKPYQGSGVTMPYWDFMGSTVITNSYIRLTPDLQSKSGAIWNSVPCKVHNWEAQVQFKVSGKGKDLFGDGFLIWYTKDRMEGGPVFGSKDFFTGLAISVDTYSNQNGPHNHQHPYISAMLNNGSKKYDHDKDGTHLQLAGCETKIRNLKHDSFIAISYENDVLKVFTDVEGKNGWKPCLEVPGVKLPTGYYFGVSAVTGELSDNHDLISFKLYSKDMPGQEFEDRSDLLPTAEFYEAPRVIVGVKESPALETLRRSFSQLGNNDGTFNYFTVNDTNYIVELDKLCTLLVNGRKRVPVMLDTGHASAKMARSLAKDLNIPLITLAATLSEQIELPTIRDNFAMSIHSPSDLQGMAMRDLVTKMNITRAAILYDDSYFSSVS